VTKDRRDGNTYIQFFIDYNQRGTCYLDVTTFIGRNARILDPYPKVWNLKLFEGTTKLYTLKYPFFKRSSLNRENYEMNILSAAEAKTRKTTQEHVYTFTPVNHTPSRSRNWCRPISDSPKAFRARILIGLNTMDSRIRCEYAKFTHGVAKIAWTRKILDFLRRPASQTSEVQDGSRQPATNLKDLDQKPSAPHWLKVPFHTDARASTTDLSSMIYIILRTLPFNIRRKSCHLHVERDRWSNSSLSSPLS